jgi:hypothetical protein
MNTIGIIQPGKLGDIIICLPIAKYYADQGKHVIWPIFNNLISMLKEVIDYVTFIPVSNNVYECVEQAKRVLYNYNVTDIFDIAATFPGSTSTIEYVKLGDGLGDIKFDLFKYNKCNVPFDNKWNLIYNRNIEKENQIINDLVKHPKYDIVSTKHSRGEISIIFESKYQIIHVNENYNIFHWRKIIEQANCIALVDSSLANFVEQCNIDTKKILIQKPGHPTPTFKNNWTIKSI